MRRDSRLGSAPEPRHAARVQILVVGLNPAVDVEWCVASVHWDEKNVVLGERRWAGGKSVNVARWLRQLGAPVKLLVPLGGATGEELQRQLHAEKVPVCAVPLREATRANVMVTQAQGPQLRFNPQGPKLSAAEWRAFVAAFTAELAQTALVIFSGALSRAARPTLYRDLLRLARHAAVRTVLDCDGDAFATGVTAKPLLVKPNVFELAQWAGEKLGSEAALLRAARKLSRVTGGWVFVSRDAQGGLLVNDNAAQGWRAAVPTVRVRNTVGAGDALLAAVATQMVAGAPPEAWLRAGLATATAGVQQPAGKLASARAIQAVARQLRLVTLT